MTEKSPIAQRFRGFLPVVVDVETGGFNPATDALLEIAAVTLRMNEAGLIEKDETFHYHVKPFAGANIEAASLQINGIVPDHPLRPAIDEKDALARIFKPIRDAVKASDCTRAILVGHNAPFDLSFVNAASERCNIKRNPFHPFSTFDTVTLSGAVLGQTVLKRAAETAGLDWDGDSAHSALYDTELTAELFCELINRIQPAFNRSVSKLTV